MIYANSIEFPPKSPVLKKLLTNLLDSKIGLIKFKKGLKLDEAKAFLGFFTLALDQIESIDEASKRFADLKLDNIEIEYAEYRKVSEKQKVFAGDHPTKAADSKIDQDTIKLMTDFMRTYAKPKVNSSGQSVKATQNKTASSSGKFKVIMDTDQISALILHIADDPDEAGSTGGDWQDLVISYLWAVSNYLLQEVQSGKSATRCIKHLNKIKKTLSQHAKTKKVPRTKIQKMEQSVAQMQEELTLESLLTSWQKEAEKTSKLSQKIITYLASLEDDALTSARARFKQVKTPGAELAEFLDQD